MPKRKRLVSGSASLVTNYISDDNTISTPVDSFQGEFIYCVQYNVIAVTCLIADINGTLTIEKSFDGETVADTSASFATVAGTHLSRREPTIYPYCRVKWEKANVLDPTPSAFHIYTIFQKEGLTVGDATLEDCDPLAAGESLICTDSQAPAFKLKKLEAGIGISLTGGTDAITIENTGAVPVITLTAGTGISTSGVSPNFTITNTAPDQTVAINAGTGISATGTYPNFTVTNTAPDQTVVLTAGTGISATGTYPNFTVTNTAPDQVVSLTAGTGIGVTGSYPNFTVTNTAPDQAITLASAGGTVSLVNTGSGTALKNKGLTAGSNITLTDNGTSVTVASSGGAVTLASAGGTQSLVANGAGPNMTVKGLTAGSGITLTNTASDVTITLTGGLPYLMNMMAIGEISYANATGTTTSGINGASGIVLKPTTTLVTTATMAPSNYFDMPQNGQLRYIGTNTIAVHTAYSLSANMSSGNNQSLVFWLKKNGVDIAKSFYYFTSSSTAAKDFTIAAHVVIDSLATNDYIEIWARNTTAANEIIIKNLNYVMMGDGYSYMSTLTNTTGTYAINQTTYSSITKRWDFASTTIAHPDITLNTATDEFTVLQTGFFTFNASVFWQGNENHVYTLLVNSVPVSSYSQTANTNTSFSFANVSLAAGDIVHLTIQTSGGGPILYSSGTSFAIVT